MRQAPFYSQCLTPRFWGGTLVALAVLGNLACLCGAASGAATKPPVPPVLSAETRHDVHACCRHGDSPAEGRHSPSPSAPVHHEQDACPHCGSGTLTAERSDSSVPSLQPLAVDSPHDALLAAPVVHHFAGSVLNAAGFGPPVTSAPTLLGLRCALNL